MKRLALSAIAAALSVSPAPDARAAAPPPSPDLGGGAQMLAPIRYKQLAVFPVVRKARPATGAAMLTLAEGLAKKLVTVSEREGGGDVNHVGVANNSDRPLLLLGGEMILGGQQDRILGKDTVVPPKQRMVVEVFCVEHGRWSGGRSFGASGGLVENKVRLRAKYRSDQGQVWDQVASKTSSLGASSSTGTYRQVAGSAASERTVKPYRDAISTALDALPDRKQLVGLVAAINGRVTSVDIFEEPSLFAAYAKHLLESIVVTAADVRETEAAARPPTVADVRGFMDKAEAAPAESVASGAGSRSVQRKNKDVVGSTLELSSPAEAAPRPVYKSYQSNE
jgi:hypothetical protein